MKRKVILNEEEVIMLYKSGLGIIGLCEHFHVGKVKIRTILKKNNIEFKKRGGQSLNKQYKVPDWKIEKYPKEDGYYYLAKAKDGTYESKDYMNNGGFLTSYIRNHYNVEIPTLYDRQEYYKETGNYWWEQWFDVIKTKCKATKKCPYCDWETIDVNNKSGAFEVHLKRIHNISKEDYIKGHPEDISYFSMANPSLNRRWEKDPSNFVKCEICGKKFARITPTHLKSHGLSKIEYIKKYGTNLVSQNLHKKLSCAAKEVNKTLEATYESNAEKEIKEFIKGLGLSAKKDKKTLEGAELDILVKEKNLAIEYNGLYWHQEHFGKTKYYHLKKTEECAQKNIKLLQIFEDEFILHKGIVFAEIKHILKMEENLYKIELKKCEVKEINKNEAQAFLEKYNLQGFSSSTVYLGSFYNGELIGIMTFVKGNPTQWCLNRFSINFAYEAQGIYKKLFSYFISHYNPSEIKTFADRRWTFESNNNLYTQLGFELKETLPPNYRYYNPKVSRYTRLQKFSFRKQLLHKKYGLPLSMTETEMAQALGYDRIWDCGLYKYVWKAPAK